MSNHRIPLTTGDKVKMVNCYEAEKYKDKIWTVRSEEWTLASGVTLVKLEGKAGGFDVDCLELVSTSR